MKNRKEIRKRKIRKQFKKGSLKLSFKLFLIDELLNKTEVFYVKLKRRNNHIRIKSTKELVLKEAYKGIYVFLEELYNGNGNCVLGNKANKKQQYIKTLIKQYEKNNKKIEKEVL